MRRERHEKSVNIPVRVRNGKVEFVFDPKFLKFTENAVGHIVMDADAVDDPKWRDFLTAERDLLLAPAESFVALRVANDKGADGLKKHLLTVGRIHELAQTKPPADAHFNDVYHPTFPANPSYWVEAQLKEPLLLRLRSRKSAQLRGGNPFVQALADLNLKQEAQAISLNQALTRVSRVFEPLRQGNTGDAFRDVMLLTGNQWILLEEIRVREEIIWEQTLSQQFDLDAENMAMWRLGGMFASSVEAEDESSQ